MTPLSQAFGALPELRELREAVEAGRCPASVSGLSPVHRAMAAAALHQAMQRPFVVLCADEGEARRMAVDLQTLTGVEPALLFAREWQLRDRVYASHSFEQQRLGTLCSLAAGKVTALVATVDGVMQRTLPPDALRDAALTLKPGGRHDLNGLARQLDASGYARAEQVEGVGQFAVRGGILDVWSPLAEPVRVEFFDDEIDAMGEFDVTTQRRTKNIKKLTVLPAAEVLPDAAEGGREGLYARVEHAARQLGRKKGAEKAVKTLRDDLERFRQHLPVGGMDRYLLACYPTTVSALDYLPADALVFLSDGARCAERARGFRWELEQDTLPLIETGELAGAFAEVSLSAEALAEKLGEFPTVQLNALPTSRDLLPPRTLLSMSVKQLPSYGGSLETAAADMQHYVAAGSGVTVLCGNETRAKNFLRLLDERGIRARPDFKNETLPRLGEITVGLGTLSAGCEIPQLKLAILTEGQLTAPVAGKKARQKQPKDSNRQKLQSYTDLSPGDLVVHVHHGIGRFVGIERMRVDGVDKDYIKLAYAGSDTLYVPATQLDLVSKYIGGGEDDDGKPATRLSKLGGTDWTRAKAKAKAAAKDLAKGLIALYAERQRRPGFAFSPDSPWQREFEDSFDYAETDDQLRAIADIKADMERKTPMDRLLCGDVGYGKTEVALRAAMKCILDGKQVAILVPTTVLAQQHYATAMARFRSFPVRIEALSRFKTPAEKKKILQATAEGHVDLLIGTHALLQKSMRFRDLGLLIIDEEQRFGVSHKERLRELARQVDTLTLSATPIPRTLNMALSGLRDMSTIETPPEGRQPVQTYVLEHDWAVIGDAIRRELARGGQVYYLHNRVETIDRCAARLRQMLGDDVGIAVAHGKLDERGLSAVMQDMETGAVQVLVCTTIIETGIDIPNVNTLVIEDADRMGLAQLHQIRGRIGRSARRAYAYMTYRPGKILTEVANKRLTAIREYAEFGSGFRIAMRDLEIRGAGNLLGPEQSGYMMSVGYDM
ncbi:MAG: transcription-repair coupling factor, partial [Oscillospiraceae bacterium]|nr:transcription-repair coupling factor [Oscillospiraceae bacterium]